jgi:hypothetical protein
VYDGLACWDVRAHDLVKGMQVKDILASLPAELYSLLPFALVPVIGNPIAMAGHGMAGADSPIAKLRALSNGLTKLLPLLGDLVKILPQDTLQHKLVLLQTGCESLDTAYAQVRP